MILFQFLTVSYNCNGRKYKITVREVTIDRYSGSEFMCIVSGKKANDVWQIVSEIVEAVRIIEPGLYRAFIDRLNEL